MLALGFLPALLRYSLPWVAALLVEDGDSASNKLNANIKFSEYK